MNRENKNSRHQGLATWLLRRLSRSMSGDIEEEFTSLKKEKGYFKAMGWYWFQILISIPSFLKSYTYGSISMLTNYLKIALRNLRRYKAYSFINISGLATGLACCILILLYIKDELSYDKHHPNYDRIYRVTLRYENPRGVSHWACVSVPIGAAFKNEVAGVQDVARIRSFESPGVMGYGNTKFLERNIHHVEQSAIDIFSFTFIKGNPSTALTGPDKVVITESMAQKYFGTEEPLGKVMNLDGKFDLQVSGVVKDIPNTSHFIIDFMLSWPMIYKTHGKWVDNSKSWAGIYTYALLEEGQAPNAVEERLPDFTTNFFGSVMTPGGSTRNIVLQPLTDIHLYSHLEKEMYANSDIMYIYVFSVIGVFVLLIASINFINLSTARSSNRGREVGVRKVLGAQRGQVAKQFLGESLVMAFFAMLLASVLVLFFLPVLNGLTGKDLMMSDFFTVPIMSALSFIALFTGLISGIYPSFYISAFQPVSIFRNFIGRSSNQDFLRKGLVLFQFAISILLIIGSTVVYDQLMYFRTKDVGFDREQVINIPTSGVLAKAISENLPAFKNILRQNPDIINAAVTSEVPGVRFSYENVRTIGLQTNVTIGTRLLFADEDFIPTMKIPFVAGRNFSTERSSDKDAFILNEAAVKRLGLQNPLETELSWGGQRGNIVGVVKDFNFASLHGTIEPLVIMQTGGGNALVVRVREGRSEEAISYLKSTVEDIAPGQLVTYTFLDDDLNSLYRTEDTLSDIIMYFSGIAVLIGCLGLFGLAAFTIEQRKKEISIRKVLGASVSGITYLLSREFTRWVLLANIIAWPVGYYVMTRWLDNFVYRIDIGFAPFVQAAVIALAIAVSTVLYQAISAALSNPVNVINKE